MAEKIGVVGAGFMGSSIAGEFARYGYPVICFDNNQDMFEKSKVSVKDNLHVLQQGGIVNENEVTGAISRISYTSDITVLAKECVFVIEAVFEDLAVKRSVFEQLDAHAPAHVILASNTSSLSIAAIAESCKDKSRVLAVHFLHPAHLVPLVEITPTPNTAPSVVERSRELLTKIGKSPVLLKKEVPGYLAARLQAALFREALYLVEQGVVSVEDADKACKDGFGRRLNQVGPMQVADMAGLDIYAKTHNVMFPSLSNATSCPLLDKMVAEGKLGAKSNEGFYKWEGGLFDQVKGKRDNELVRRLKE
eukprot:Phypoly_transcript_13289.p1 GENE.Phypoly_transcript_13289~~Phypoly_transcript_13289.p1  ORF type:complete len:334 (+),score=72.40 Phypoly_transcript_13289:84-1004(+)